MPRVERSYQISAECEEGVQGKCPVWRGGIRLVTCVNRGCTRLVSNVERWYQISVQCGVGVSEVRKMGTRFVSSVEFGCQLNVLCGDGVPD